METPSVQKHQIFLIEKAPVVQKLLNEYIPSMQFFNATPILPEDTGTMQQVWNEDKKYYVAKNGKILTKKDLSFNRGKVVRTSNSERSKKKFLDHKKLRETFKNQSKKNSERAQQLKRNPQLKQLLQQIEHQCIEYIQSNPKSPIDSDSLTGLMALKNTNLLCDFTEYYDDNNLPFFIINNQKINGRAKDFTVDTLNLNGLNPFQKQYVIDQFLLLK